MSKKIAEQIGVDTKYYGQGIYAGTQKKFNYLLKYDNTSLCFTLTFNVVGNEDLKKLNQQIKAVNQETTVKYKNNILNIVGSCEKNSKLPIMVNPLLSIVIDYLTENKYQEVCKSCHKKAKTSLVNNEGEISFICDSCYKNIAEIAKYKEENAKKNKEHLILGTIGAIIGTIPGIIVWLILGYLKLEPSLASILITLGSAVGYKKLSKNIKLPGLIISILIGLLGIIVAHELNCSIYIYELYKENYNINLFDAYKAIPYYLNKISEFKKNFYNCLITSYVLSITGIFTSYSFYRQSAYKADIKKLGE